MVHFEYTVMSFGLVNAPPTFSHLMNFIVNLYTNDFVLVYLNDILVFSKNKGDHAKHLRLVLDKLRVHQFYAKFSKCEFWLDEVLYLGHIISAKGIAVIPEKVSANCELGTSLECQAAPQFPWACKLLSKIR